MNDELDLITEIYERHKGLPLTVANRILKSIIEPDSSNGSSSSFGKQDPGQEYSLSITGSAGKLLSAVLGIGHVNEIVCQSLAVRKFLPSVKTVFEMGGEDSKLIILDDSGIEDFSMNSVCAAGTGSFLEQQAERLKLSIEEFSRLATQSKSPPRIAGRCSVFAKSDMIHLQQIATPLEDIVAGLCFAVVRNFKGAIVKGRKIVPRVSFQGGVAANAGIVRAFNELFNIDVVVPEKFAFMGAVGAVMKDMQDAVRNPCYLGRLEGHLGSRKASDNGRSPLIIEGDDFLVRHGIRDGVSKDSAVPGALWPDAVAKLEHSEAPDKIRSFLGIDIGSISTNLALIDEHGRLLSKRYLMTAGRPIDAVMTGLREMGHEIGERVEIAGVGTTGSGRYMIADFVAADVVKNEITAQARAAIFIDKNVDTIFEIGGQDSKFISINNGMVVDFEMNKACAAGTGSFLEEQAEKLNISIKQEFAECAFASDHPCNLGERCTVFMENSLMANLQQGVQKDDLLAGLAYSIVENYINRVVASKKIGKNIFFQGGTAFNKSVVAAFEKFTGQHITVPPNHDVTGAIGMALIAREEVSLKPSGYRSSFRGFGLSDSSYATSSFSCRGCSNVCEINRVSIEGEKGFLYYGGRCEKYDIRKRQKSHIEDLFAFREEMLWKQYTQKAGQASSGSRKIGIPYIFFFQDLLPFWTTLMLELGFDLTVSPRTNREIVNLGSETVLSEACFPVKVAHGHIKYLIDHDVENILLPSFVSLKNRDYYFDKESPCPYTQTIPYMARSAFRNANILSPIIDFRRGDRIIIKEIKRALKQFRVSEREIKAALSRAHERQREFEEQIQNKGRAVLSSIEDNAIVIVGRAYNSFDNGMNLQLPQKLASLNVQAIPMDFLPVKDVDITDRWPQMYWKSGKKIIQAARIIKNNPNLFPVYISNFNCGPDSFIFEYFKEEIGDKQHLFLEIDEHSADAGAITRCEAFLDSIENIQRADHSSAVSVKQKIKMMRSNIMRLHKKKVFIPRMCDHAYGLAAAFEFSGVATEVLPEPDRKTVEIGRKNVSGKQCFPCILTIGEMLKKVFSNGSESENFIFFMPAGTGPCRFGQYNIFQKLVLDRLGLNDVRVFSPVQDSTFYKELGIAGDDFIKRAWEGLLCIEILTKCLHESRPYEKEEGLTDHIYKKNLDRVYHELRGRKGRLEKVLEQIRGDFDSIPKYEERKPLIGIIGEIFVRSSRFTNEELIKKINVMGGEAWLSPPEEWIYYVNYIGLKHALIKHDFSTAFKLFMKNRVQVRTEHKYTNIFNGKLRTLNEPSTREILKKARPYIHESFEGETILSVGKAIDLIDKGVSGIVNAMPFGCMPGTIVTALMRAISKDYNIPSISIPYDGTESVTTDLQLEAFMHQSCEFKQQGFDKYTARV